MTELLYLKDSELIDIEARVLEIKEAGMDYELRLDKTIFYPQSGGQPCDLGMIYLDDKIFDIKEVWLENNEIWHVGSFRDEKFEVNDEVILKIDKIRRRLNSRLHSAGHLIDCASEELGLLNTILMPTKAYQFPNGAYVEYAGELENPADYIPKYEEILADLVAQNLKITATNLSHEEAIKARIDAPQGKDVRVVQIGNFTACGCGGTHVSSTSQIGKIKIRKIKNKKGIVRISYELEKENL